MGTKGEIGKVWVINVISDKTEPAPVSPARPVFPGRTKGWRDNENNRGLALVSNKSSAIIRDVP